VWSTTTGTRVNDATAVTSSVKCFNSWKLYPASGNIFRKWFTSYFFIYSRAFNNNVISSGKSYCCNDFYWRPVYIAASKKYLRRIVISLFYAVRINISLAIFCLKFSFKLVTFSKGYARKQSGCFFSEHSVHSGSTSVDTFGFVIISRSRFFRLVDHFLYSARAGCMTSFVGPIGLTWM